MTPIKVLAGHGLLSWPVLAHGFRNGWVTKACIEAYATDRLARDLNGGDADVASLAMAEPTSDAQVAEALSSLSRDVGALAFEDTWRFAKLKSLQKEASSDEVKLARLQELYSEFDYPPDMAACSIYAQSDVGPFAALASVVAGLEAKLSA